MKKIWQIFEYEKYDILVTRNYNEKSHYYTVDFSFCPEVGNTATISLSYDDQANADKAFFSQTSETVANFAKYIIDSLGGEGIFADGGPDEVELSLNDNTVISLR